MAGPIVVFIVISLLVAYFLGRKRQIGFGWSLFFCVFLTPLIGFIVVMLSPKYYANNPEPSQAKRIWGWILIVVFAISGLGGLIAAANNPDVDARALNSVSFAIGFIGLGIYLIELGKGKNFNSQEVMKQ